MGLAGGGRGRIAVVTHAQLGRGTQHRVGTDGTICSVGPAGRVGECLDGYCAGVSDNPSLSEALRRLRRVRDANLGDAVRLQSRRGGMRWGRTGIANCSWPLATLTLFSTGVEVGPTVQALCLLVPSWRARLELGLRRGSRPEPDSLGSSVHAEDRAIRRFRCSLDAVAAGRSCVGSSEAGFPSRPFAPPCALVRSALNS